jgi:hypothetical protein
MSNIKLPIPGRDQPCPNPGHGQPFSPGHVQPFPPRSQSTVPTQVTVNRSHPGHGKPFPPRSRSTVLTQVTVNGSHPGHGQPFPPRSRSTSPIRGQSQPTHFPVTVNLPIQDQGHPVYHRSWCHGPPSPLQVLVLFCMVIPEPVSGAFVGLLLCKQC